MSLHATPGLSAKRRRSRKAQLAARDGQRCTYCRRPFAVLREATLDHVVPISLYRTWSARNLVLACQSCNNVKADRLPLSLALLVLFTTVHEQHTGAVHEQSGERVGRPYPDVLSVDWSLLARLAYANESAARSTREQHESTLHGVGVVGPTQHVHRARSADQSTRTRLCAQPRTPACVGGEVAA